MARDDGNVRLNRVLEAASREFAKWPQWKRDLATADILQTKSGQTPDPEPVDDLD